jgi:hypothetical protein
LNGDEFEGMVLRLQVVSEGFCSTGGVCVVDGDVASLNVNEYGGALTFSSEFTSTFSALEVSKIEDREKELGQLNRR